jgi:hypothetical protein
VSDFRKYCDSDGRPYCPLSHRRSERSATVVPRYVCSMGWEQINRAEYARHVERFGIYKAREQYGRRFWL